MRVAIDVTPLLGNPTGVARTVHGLLGGIARVAPHMDVQHYVVSRRARRTPGAADLPQPLRFLPVPAGVALRAWGRVDVPSGDGWLRDTDVVHGTNFVVPPLRRRPTSVTVHDTWCARNPATCDPVARAYTPVLRRAVARGTWLHVSTEFVADEVRDVYGAERVAVVPFGVPPVEPPATPLATGPPFVLAIGTVEPRKNLDGLVRAFALLADDVPEVRLVLAGPDGPGRPALDAALDELAPAVRARVDVVGAVDEEHRNQLLHAAGVLAYPSRSEGFGFPVLEAMAAGIPVVATAVGAIPEVAGDAAALVALDDDAALADALTRALTDEEARARLMDAGRRQAAGFSWERTAFGLVDLWHRMAGDER
jgi:glycosyltransferase involved in cell wall biosynthesis